MRADIIHMLMLDVVKLGQTVDATDNFRIVRHGLDKIQQHKVAFLLNYSDLQLGWNSARMFAQAHAKLPCYLTADDLWVWRAYLANCNPNKYFDPHIAEALALLDESMRFERHLVQAFLWCEDASTKDIAERTGLKEDTIIAYEKLFYNVRDRVADHGFLAKVVYPQGRLEELYDDYLANATFGDLLRRTGYNCGKDYVSFMAGLRSKLIQDMAGADMAVRLERVIMANGYILASSGMINQRHNAQGLRTAQSMITAAKAGGTESQEQSGFDDVHVSIALRGEMARIGRSDLQKNQVEAKRRQERTLDVAVEVLPDGSSL
jgi:hypothetical protein